jgi:hypothetical protein
MGNLLWLVTTIYFVGIILAIYHLQQRDLDRLQRQFDEMAAGKNFGES